MESAREAKTEGIYARNLILDLDEVLTKVIDGNLENSLMDVSSDGEIVVYKLPGGNLAVPLLGIDKTKLMTDFVHLRDEKCTVESCLKEKTRLHTLMLKGVPVCRHLLLGMCFELTPAVGGFTPI